MELFMGLMFFAMVAIGIYLLVASMKKERYDEQELKISAAREGFLERCVFLLNKHQRALYRNWKIKITVDDYGVVDASEWIKELNYFYENVVLLDEQIKYHINMIGYVFSNRGEGFNKNYFIETFAELANAAVLEMDKSRMVQSNEGLVEECLSGRDYEVYCLDILKRDGWSVQRTPSTGDQGVDIIATDENVRVVIQCKFYSSPVGNAAVQEVVAGKSFYDGDYAVVVSNNSFTSSAKLLAQSNGVILLHHDQLHDLRGVLGFAEARDAAGHAIGT